MPLIFAIDSDKRQSAQLASLLRSHVDADLVQSASAVEGLDILQGRVPDLILTSSLLSPRDEAALDSHLRELGVAAAHVQTLTIPVIAGASTASSKKKPAGMLAALRREKKPAAKPSGCDPDVFASEVRLYLERAMDQREALRAVLPPDVPAPIADADTRDSLLAAIASVEPAVEPPTIVMLAPTVVAVVVKQPPEPHASVVPSEAAPVAPEPEPAPEPLSPSFLDAAPLILPEPEADTAHPLSIFTVLRDVNPAPPDSAPLPDAAPVDDLLLVAPLAIEAVIEADPIEQLLAVPVATVEAAEQLLIAAVPEPVSELELDLGADSEPGLEQQLQLEPAPEPEAVSADLPVLELTPALVETADAAVAAEPSVLETEPPVLEDDVEPVPDRSWSFDAPREESLQLDQLLQQAGGDERDTEAAVAEPLATALPPSGMASAEFAQLLAPPPTRIADAIRMPEEPVPTVDMVECHDLDALADHFAAAGLTAAVADPPPVVEPAVEPTVEPVFVAPVEPPAEPWVEATARPEIAEVVPVVEATAIEEIPEEVPAVEAAAIEETFDEVPVIEAASMVETVEEPPPIDVPIADEPIVETPVQSAVIAEAAFDGPRLAWSWLEDEALPLADLLSEQPDSVPAPAEPFTPVVEAPAVVAAVEATVFVEEIYDPVASASWNLAASTPATEDRGLPAAIDAVPAETALIQPPPAAPEIPVAESATWDPISAAAWEAAVVPAPVAATPQPAPLPVVAPEPEPDSSPAVEPVPDVEVPLLDAEVLAMLGMAAHRAGLDALETLDAPPAAAEPATPSEARGRKRPRQERFGQNRSQRRDARAGRKVPRKEPRPAQDEWGIFDPSQCGPDALFDDEEWLDDDDRPARSRATTY